MDFIEYLEEKFETRRTGTQLWVKSGQCPFCLHDSDDLRLYVSLTSRLGCCHHCGKGFNATQFVMAAEGVGRKKARQILGGFASFDHDDREEEEPDPLEVPWPVLEDVFDYPEAHEYLNSRNVTDGMIRAFGIRHCVTNMPYGDKIYYTARRVVIPIFDLEGSPVGWQGRDITGRSKMKYLFPSNFNAGHYLFNGTYIKAKGIKDVILCEGTFDAFGWIRRGKRNVMATFGKKLSPLQKSALCSMGIEHVTLAWDSDATWEKHEFVEKHGHLFDVDILDLKGKDSDEASGVELKNALAGTRAYSWEEKILSRLNVL